MPVSGELTDLSTHDRDHRAELSLVSRTKRRLVDSQRDDPEQLVDVGIVAQDEHDIARLGRTRMRRQVSTVRSPHALSPVSLSEEPQS